MPSVSIFVCLFCCLFTFPSLAAGQDSSISISHGPFLQNATETSITIIWLTDKKAVSWVEYGTGENRRTFPEWGSLMETARSSRHGLFAANTTTHRVTLNGLKAGLRYRYRVVSKQIIQFEPYEVIFGETTVSDIFEFQTLVPGKQQPFTFHIFQDIHENSDKLDPLLEGLDWRQVDMVFFNGDTVNHLMGIEQIFSGFLDSCVKRFAREIPFVYIRGNHDTRGPVARELETIIPPRQGKYYYSFNHGPVHFIILDTGEDKEDSHPVYGGLVDFDAYRQEQADWLKQDLESKASVSARYNIILQHIPPYGRGHGSTEVSNLWVPLFNRAGIDLLLCGHNHRFTVRKSTSGENNFPLVIGPAGGYIAVNVTEEKLAVEIFSIKGKSLGKLELNGDGR